MVVHVNNFGNNLQKGACAVWNTSWIEYERSVCVVRSIEWSQHYRKDSLITFTVQDFMWKKDLLLLLLKKKTLNKSLLTEAAEAKLDTANECFTAVQEKQ